MTRNDRLHSLDAVRAFALLAGIFVGGYRIAMQVSGALALILGARHSVHRGVVLAELRVDPFSGQDFVYQRQGESFTLYTVGDNLKDDGGRHDPRWADGDFVFWPRPD